MKTYESNGYRYYYDTHLKMWVIYQIDEQGNQISMEAEYYPNKKALFTQYNLGMKDKEIWAALKKDEKGYFVTVPVNVRRSSRMKISEKKALKLFSLYGIKNL